MPSVNIGSNLFENVAIPLVLDDRFFLVEYQEGRDIWTVFTFHEGQPVVEVLRNTPQENHLSTVETNPTGILTVSDSDTGRFLYKIRPGAMDSSIFGTLAGRETEIRVVDRELRVGTNVFASNVISGFPVGLMVRDGAIAVGAGLPPEFGRLVGS